MSKLNRSRCCLPPVWAVVLAAIIFGLLAFQVVTTGGSSIDAPIYNAVSKLICPALTAVVTVVTHMGGTAVLVAISVVVGILFWKKWGWKTALISPVNLLVASNFSNKIVKNLVQRPRPALEQLVAQSGYSFPSGHSLSAMVFYGLIAIILFNRLQGKKRWWAAVLLSLLILLVGFSRIYVGVHYASDVIAGLCEGFVWLGLLTRIPAVTEIVTGKKKV